MNLKEAIERGEEDAARGHCSIRLLSDEWNAILAAAKKQLAAEEAAKPKRASLRELEEHLRLERCDAPWEVICPKTTAAADILKALRETVVPWLLAVRKEAGDEMQLVHPCRAEFSNMLRALGEEP